MAASLVFFIAASAAYQPRPAHRALRPVTNLRSLRAPFSSQPNERERAQQRKNDAALRAEFSGPDSSSVDDDLAMLRDRIDLVETKETQLSEIKEMLRTMGAGLGLQLVDSAGEITVSAWVFVALNVLVTLYAANTFLLAPLAKSAEVLSQSVS